MQALLRNRVSLVWLILVAATALSWEMGHGWGLNDMRQASIAIIFVATAKVRFVLMDFMEIRHAPWVMRIAGELWCAAIGTTLVVLYLRGY